MKRVYFIFLLLNLLSFRSERAAGDSRNNTTTSFFQFFLIIWDGVRLFEVFAQKNLFFHFFFLCFVLFCFRGRQMGRLWWGKHNRAAWKL